MKFYVAATAFTTLLAVFAGTFQGSLGQAMIDPTSICTYTCPTTYTLNRDTNKCECVDSSYCSWGYWNIQQCKCVPCTTAGPCGTGMKWDQDQCKCVCSPIYDCILRPYGLASHWDPNRCCCDCNLGLFSWDGCTLQTHVPVCYN